MAGCGMGWLDLLVRQQVAGITPGHPAENQDRTRQQS